MKVLIHHTIDSSRSIGVFEGVPEAIDAIERHSGRTVPAHHLVLGLRSQECHPVGSPEGEWYEIRHVAGDLPELTDRTYVFGVGRLLLRSVSVEASSLDEAERLAREKLDAQGKGRPGVDHERTAWQLALLAGPQGEGAGA